MSDQPTIPFHDGNSIPQVGLGVWQAPNDAAVTAVKAALAAGYRRVDMAIAGDLRERRGRRRGHPRLRRRPVGDLPHDEAVECRSGLRLRAEGLRCQPEAARDRLCRSLPHPLAGAEARGVRRQLEGPDPDPQGRPRPLDRRLELLSRASAAHHRRDRRHARHQPGRAASGLSAGGGARLPREAPDRHPVLEPARPGQAAGGPRHRRHRGKTRPHAGAGHHPLAHRQRPRRHPEIRDPFAHRGKLQGLRLHAGCRGHEDLRQPGSGWRPHRARSDDGNVLSLDGGHARLATHARFLSWQRLRRDEGGKPALARRSFAPQRDIEDDDGKAGGRILHS